MKSLLAGMLAIFAIIFVSYWVYPDYPIISAMQYGWKTSLFVVTFAVIIAGSVAMDGR